MLVSLKLKVLIAYIRTTSWEDIIIIVVDLLVDQIGDDHGIVLSVDQKADCSHAACLYLSSINANTCSGLYSLITVLQIYPDIQHTSVAILARYT
jgi:hypothetical protein